MSCSAEYPMCPISLFNLFRSYSSSDYSEEEDWQQEPEDNEITSKVTGTSTAGHYLQSKRDELGVYEQLMGGHLKIGNTPVQHQSIA